MIAIEIEVRYVDGLPVSGPRREVVPFGSAVEVQVSGRPSGQVHLRGYEQYAEVEDASPGVLRFTADVPGTFTLEFDRRGQQLALIEVLEPPASG